PMQGGDVLATGLRVAVAERHVDGATDLLVVEDVADSVGDAEVVAEGELAQVAGALVQLELLIEVLLALHGGRLHHLAAREAQAHILHKTAVDDAGNGEADVALGGVFDGTSKEFPAGEVTLAVAVAEGAVSDRESQIGVGTDDVDALPAAQPVHVELLPATKRAPARRGILIIQEACLIDELRKVAQRHVGILGVGGGGIEGEAGVNFPRGHAPAAGLTKLMSRAAGDRL